MIQKIYQRSLPVINKFKKPSAIIVCGGGGSYLIIKKWMKWRAIPQAVEKNNLKAIPNNKQTPPPPPPTKPNGKSGRKNAESKNQTNIGGN